MSNGILQPDTPFKYTSRNPRTSYRKLKRGEIFLVEHEIEESVWNQIRTLPENAIIENVSWYHDGDSPASQTITVEVEPKPEPKEKGPYSLYWHRMFKNGFYNYPPLIQKLECTGDQIRLRLHDVFQVKTLSDVSPEIFEGWMEQEPELFASLITMSRLANVITEQKGQNENHAS